MTKASLTKISLITLIAAMSLNAKPMLNNSATLPSPVGGIKAVQQQTQYPLWAMAQNIESSVLLSFRVNENGSVSDMQVVRSGGSIFDESAISAVMNTEWIPASQNDRNVSTVFELPFEFTAR